MDVDVCVCVCMCVCVCVCASVSQRGTFTNSSQLVAGSNAAVAFTQRLRQDGIIIVKGRWLP